ncbi:hypothetical protein KFE98_07485 [bacterium SCSIO 12741]|nr:hypothetical protein KFE98_07485 [bacterium SCSIO 12741]
MKATGILVLFCSVIFGWQMHEQDLHKEYQQVISSGMVFRWKVENDSLRVKLRAPTSGWLAVGFNRQSGIVGSALIMGANRDGVSQVEEQFVIGPQQHPPVSKLGSATSIAEAICVEKNGVSEMTFCLPLQAQDKWHCDLQSSGPIYVALAYSREDDFDHHSAVRTEVKITLKKED